MIYRHDHVTAVQHFFRDLYPVVDGQSVKEHLSLVADRMYTGLIAGELACHVICRNWHPETIGMEYGLLVGKKWTLEDARIAIAKEHGFNSWESVGNHLVYREIFEQFIDLLLVGNLNELALLLVKDVATLESKKDSFQSLITTSSPYGHHATPIHYICANATETRRQQTPYNLVKVIQFLLDNGADKTATIHVYGKECTPLELLTSSAHPYVAGVGKEAERLLH